MDDVDYLADATDEELTNLGMKTPNIRRLRKVLNVAGSQAVSTQAEAASTKIVADADAETKALADTAAKAKAAEEVAQMKAAVAKAQADADAARSPKKPSRRAYRFD